MAEAITKERFGGIKEAFQILTDCPRVEVYADPDGDKVKRYQSPGRKNVSWRVGMKVGDGHWAELHEMGHVIFDSFGGAERFLSKFDDKRLHTVWNTAEDVRIERLAQRHFDKPIWRHHRQALIDQAESYGMKSLDNLVHMIQGLLYDLLLPLAGNENERKALEYFKDDLIASTRSKDSADTAKIAIRIAHYMDWLDEVSAPPKPPEPVTPTDEPGDDGDGGGDTEPEPLPSEPSPDLKWKRVTTTRRPDSQAAVLKTMTTNRFQMYRTTTWLTCSSLMRRLLRSTTNQAKVICLRR